MKIYTINCKGTNRDGRDDTRQCTDLFFLKKENAQVYCDKSNNQLLEGRKKKFEDEQVQYERNFLEWTTLFNAGLKDRPWPGIRPIFNPKISWCDGYLSTDECDTID